MAPGPNTHYRFSSNARSRHVYPSTVNGFRWLFRKRYERGLDDAFRRVGRRILLDTVRYLELIRMAKELPDSPAASLATGRSLASTPPARAVLRTGARQSRAASIALPRPRSPQRDRATPGSTGLLEAALVAELAAGHDCAVREGPAWRKSHAPRARLK